MDKKPIIQAIEKVKEISPKRNFKQSFDFIINLKGINLKKPEEKLELFITLPFSKGKKVKACALIDQDLNPQAKGLFDRVILKEEFTTFKKKEIKKIAMEYDFFIAQANLMAQIATSFGKVLGPKQKMPNPKAGCVVPQTATLKPVYERLQKLVKVATKNEPAIKVMVGHEEMKEEEIAENILAVYNAVIHALPQEKANIKLMLLKYSMGPVVEITEKGPVIHQKVTVEKKPKIKK